MVGHDKPYRLNLDHQVNKGFSSSGLLYKIKNVSSI
jgi:hypothetical protein